MRVQDSVEYCRAIQNELPTTVLFQVYIGKSRMPSFMDASFFLRQFPHKNAGSGSGDSKDRSLPFNVETYLAHYDLSSHQNVNPLIFKSSQHSRPIHRLPGIERVEPAHRSCFAGVVLDLHVSFGSAGYIVPVVQTPVDFQRQPLPPSNAIDPPLLADAPAAALPRGLLLSTRPHHRRFDDFLFSLALLALIRRDQCNRLVYLVWILAALQFQSRHPTRICAAMLIQSHDHGVAVKQEDMATPARTHSRTLRRGFGLARRSDGLRFSGLATRPRLELVRRYPSELCACAQHEVRSMDPL
ncbi:hypothetical protein R3P38DRAFT_3236757 [Favolaschia claudopus]|uniref:Uncharacterized protein n=1 Tax=Favolaschia claudopus TaxID=2862362 RepID=A0AAV9ZCC7_9AGAR